MDENDAEPEQSSVNNNVLTHLVKVVVLNWPEKTGEVDITGQVVNPGSELDQANVGVLIIWIEKISINLMTKEFWMYTREK